MVTWRCDVVLAMCSRAVRAEQCAGVSALGDSYAFGSRSEKTPSTQPDYTTTLETAQNDNINLG
jgi:hypothetical protein